jgi:hypothetical protein
MKSFCSALLAVALLELSNGQLYACAACFGKSDSNMAQGMNMGIFALLLVVTSVLAGVASFFVYIGRREAQVNEANAPLDSVFPENQTNS